MAIHSNEHADSYYLASLTKPVANYTSLNNGIDVDVCIVGAGFTGLSSAIELAERGYSVAIVESHKVGWGASGRNGGQIIRGIGQNLQGFSKEIGQKGVDEIIKLGLKANDVVLERIAKYQIECDLTMGYADIATRAKDIVAFEQDIKYLERYDYPHKIALLDKTETQQQVVGSTKYLGSLTDAGSGHLNPLKLCYAEAQVAASLGVKIFENSRVASFTSGKEVIVKTENGQVKAKHLILAGNAYLGQLAPKIANKVLPAGSYVIATEPLSANVSQKILPNNHAVCDQKIDLDYFRLSADNRLLFGGMCNYSGRDPKDIKAVLQPKMLKLFPELTNTAIDYQWGGMIGIGANRLPQIGRLAANVFFAQAYSGHGVNVTHVAGKILAEEIAGEGELFQHFSKVNHLTFPGGKLLRSPLLALGMMFHKLRDAF